MIHEVVILVLIYFSLFFIVGTVIRNNSIVDFGWGIGFVLISLFSMWRANYWDFLALLTTTLIAFWGLRLFGHIFKRNHGQPEDFRYANWRKAWGKWVIPRSFLQVYMLQGIFMLTIAYPIVWIHESDQRQWTGLATLGLSLWLLGYAFEVIGDAQLKAFKSNPANKGKLMTRGLWRYTRHPNYFGEATLWWGVAFIAYAVTQNLFVFFSPLVITILVRFVSGVPMLEKSMKKREGFEDYAQQTNAFFPWFVKKTK